MAFCLMMKTSIVVPVYNEQDSLKDILEKLISLDIEKEIICIDDCSTDSSKEILNDYEKKRKIRLLRNDANMGKGHCLKKGIRISKGEIIAVQDADNEYEPNDLLILVRLIEKEGLDIVFGSRFLDKKDIKMNLFYLGNRFLSNVASFLYKTKINDMHTCYKVSRKSHLDSLCLTGEGFDLDSEIVAKTLRKGVNIKEVAISYNPRTKDEGKKIKAKDGFISLWVLVKCRFCKI